MLTWALTFLPSLGWEERDVARTLGSCCPSFSAHVIWKLGTKRLRNISLAVGSRGSGWGDCNLHCHACPRGTSPPLARVLAWPASTAPLDL